MWTAASSSCHLPFPAMMNYDLELWARICPFSLSCFFQRILLQEQEKKLRQWLYIKYYCHSHSPIQRTETVVWNVYHCNTESHESPTSWLWAQDEHTFIYKKPHQLSKPKNLSYLSRICWVTQQLNRHQKPTSLSQSCFLPM